METLDLDVNNYSLTELYDLFYIKHKTLTTENMKEAKKIVLKMHPDKSKLDRKYFLFFSSAYKRLYAIYEFQNKTEKNTSNTEYSELQDEKEKETILHQLFAKNKELKNPTHFNEWFNMEFEKQKIQEDDTGYGDWLKTNEGIYIIDNVTKENMNTEFEKQKKQAKTVVVYNGVNDPYTSTFGASVLGKNTDFSSGVFDHGGLSYQDLKQAHLETIIPVTNEDYHTMPKFRNTEEYKRYRETQDITPMNEIEATKLLHKNNATLEEESASLAYYYAEQSEIVNKKQQDFWAKILHLTNGQK